MKPSKEQIEAWMREYIGASVVTPELEIIANVAYSEGWKLAVSDRADGYLAVAYAAGRKAGMEEAQQCCRDMRAQFDAEAGLLQASGASYCIEAIDAAMEADK